MHHNLVLGLVVVALVVILQCDSIVAVRKKIPSYSAEVTQLESPIAAYSPRFRSSLARSINFGNQRVYGAAATGARSLSPRSLLPRSRLSRKRSSARSGQRKIKREQTPIYGSHKEDPQADLRVKRDEQVDLETKHECSSSQSKGKGKGTGKGGKSKNAGGISLLSGSHKFSIPGLTAGDLEISPSTQSVISSPVGVGIGAGSGSGSRPSITATGLGSNPIVQGNSQTSRGVTITGFPDMTGSSTSLGLGKGNGGQGSSVSTSSLGPTSGISVGSSGSPIGAQIETEPLALQSSPEASVSIDGNKGGQGSSNANALSLNVGSGSDLGESEDTEQTSSTTGANIGGSSESLQNSQPAINVSGLSPASIGASTPTGSASIGQGNNDFSLSVSPTGGDSEGPVSLMTSVDDTANSGPFDTPTPGGISTSSLGSSSGPIGGKSDGLSIKAGSSSSDDQFETTQQNSGESEKSSQIQGNPSDGGEDNTSQAGGSNQLSSGDSLISAKISSRTTELPRIIAKVDPSENGIGLQTSLGDIGTPISVGGKSSLLKPSSGNSGLSSGSQINTGFPGISVQDGNISSELGTSSSNVGVGLGSPSLTVDPSVGSSITVGNQSPSSQEGGSSSSISTLQANSPTSATIEANTVEPSGSDENESRSGAGVTSSATSGSGEPASEVSQTGVKSSSSNSDFVPKLSIKQGKLGVGNKKVKMGIKMPALYESPKVSELPAKCRSRLYDMKRALAELVALTENFGQKVLLDRSLSYLTREILSRRLREVRSLAKEARLAGSLGNLVEFKETARDAGLEALRIGNLQSTKKLEPSWTLFAQSLRRLFSSFKKACKV